MHVTAGVGEGGKGGGLILFMKCTQTSVAFSLYKYSSKHRPAVINTTMHVTAGEEGGKGGGAESKKLEEYNNIPVHGKCQSIRLSIHVIRYR